MPPRTLDAAWSELEAGHWRAALEAFRASVAEDARPEALEGLSWAAWWLDDEELLFQARGEAYALYKRRHDASAAARMATWLACDEIDFHGAFAVARGWLARANRLLGTQDPCPEQGWLAFFEGYVASVEGDDPRALDCASRAAGLGRRFGVDDIEMLGLGLEGATLVRRGEIEPGMSRLDEAAAVAVEGRAGIPISSAWTCCFLVSACTSVQDYERAVTWCDRIAEFAERYGSRYMLGFCRAEYAAVHLWRGTWSEADALLSASVDDFAHSRPAFAGGPLATLAELRRRQDRPDQAAALLDAAGPSAAAHLCRARLALDAGDAAAAVALGRRVLRRSPGWASPARIPVLELLVRAHVACGDLDDARTALENLRGIARLVATAPLAASCDLADGLLLARTGDHEAAVAALEDAVDGFERSGGRFDAAVAQAALATSLLALERVEAAQHEGSRALRRFVELGARREAERTQRLLERDVSPPGVTPREREVLDLLAEGMSNRQIAERLVVSEHTVHRHVANILRKLDLPSRAAAAAYAVRERLRDHPA